MQLIAKAASKIFIASILVTLIQIFPLTSFAHSGGTDSNGGHRSSSTGEYHYHHGYSAHQHTDGNCPYNFDDKTGASSGTSSNYTSNTSGDSGSTVLLCVLAITALTCSTLFIIHKIKEKQAAAQARLQYQKEREQYIALYGGKDIAELAKIPLGNTIGDDGLPKSINSDGWGDVHTFYRSYGGDRYHRKSCQYALFPIHAFHIYNRIPCRVCKPDKPLNYAWYIKYMEIKKTKEYYDID